MSDLENSKPNESASGEPLPAPSMPQSLTPRLTLSEVEATADMLIGFYEGVSEGTYKGKHLVHIAQGLMFIKNMVAQSQRDVQRIKGQQEEMKKKAKEAIKEAGGKINTEVVK